MTSSLWDEFRGLGLRMSPEELARVNLWRQQKYQANTKPPLLASPGLVIKEVGVNREGYWRSADFTTQIADAMDCIECLYGDVQVF